MADNVDPFLIPAEDPRADLVSCERSNGLAVHAGCAIQIEHPCFGRVLPLFQRFDGILEQRQLELCAIVIQINKERAVGLVEVLVDVEKRCVR
jgi:hypothetical protein